MGYNGPMKKVPPQICWGKDNEDRALQCYIKNRQQCEEDMEVEAGGLYLMPDRSFIEASSDGKVFCKNVDTCCWGCLEIKCPYSINGQVTVSMSPMEIADKHTDFFYENG